MTLVSARPTLSDDSDLLFDIEVDGKVFGGVQTVQRQLSDLVRNSIRRWSAPVDSFCNELLEAVKRLRSGLENGNVINKKCLAQSLADKGYCVHLRMAHTKVTPGMSCMSRPHVFITANAHKSRRVVSSREDIVVEVDLKSEFKMQNPPMHYQLLLEFLPDEFVGSHGRFLEMVCLMCDEMRAAFAECGRTLPPWREKNVVLSKWRLKPSRDDVPLCPKIKAPLKVLQHED